MGKRPWGMVGDPLLGDDGKAMSAPRNQHILAS